MARGTALTIPPPKTTLLGEALNVPGGGLTKDSYNWIVRTGSVLVDAFMRTRPGMNILGAAINQYILGSIFLRDKTDTVRLIVGTQLGWWRFNNATLAWTDISGGTALTGATTMPVTFAYWQIGNLQYVIGVNDADIPKQADPATGNYSAIAAAPIARSVAVIANRAVYCRTKEGGTTFPSRVRWSSSGDQTTYPAGANNDVGDTADQCVAIRPLGRRQGILHKEWSQWGLLARQNASDANAFEFVLLDQQPGPLGPAAVCKGPGGGLQCYLGQDGNLYTFDGVRAQILAFTDKLIQGRINFNAKSYTCLVYYAQEQELLATVSLDTDVVPTHLLRYSFKTGGFYLEQYPTGLALTHVGLMISEVETVTDSLPNITTDTLPDIPTDQLGVSARGMFVLFGTTTSVFTSETGQDNTTNITGDAQIQLPILEGKEYEFDGVEAIFVQPTQSVSVQISVKIGATPDTLTETVLGSIDPFSNQTTVPTASVPSTAPAAALRGRVVIVRLLVTAGVTLTLRHLELWVWGRALAT